MSSNVSPEPTEKESAENQPPAHGKRRLSRFQFGLRSLLVITLLVGAMVGILARRIALAQRQREIVTRLLEAGFVVQYDHGARDGAVAPSRPDDGVNFWQKLDFWHNVSQIQSIYFVPNSPQTMRLIAELPHLEKIEFVVGFQDGAELPHFPRLACRKRLRLLRIGNFPLQRGDLIHIGECQSLASLEIRVEEDSSRQLAALDRLQQLASLRINGPVRDEGVAAWQHLARLEVLQLDDVQQVSGESLAALLLRNPGLRRVELGKANCTAEVCDALGQCRSLTQLSLPEAQLGDDGLTRLRGLRLLAGLDISRTQVHGMAFDGIDSFAGLRQLSAEGTPISDDGAFLVGRLPQLRSLNLSHTKVTDVACEHLSRHDLVTLNLANDNITDRGINSLHCERLAKLNLYETSVTARAFASASQWPSLELLILGKPTNSEDDLERVLQIPLLKKLYAHGEFSPEFQLRYSKRFAQGWTKEWTE